MTWIHKDLVRRWNLWFSPAAVFAEVLAGRATGMQITFSPYEKKKKTRLFIESANLSTKSDTGFESRFPDESGSGCLPGRFQNVVDSLRCRNPRQSCRRVSWSDCTINANKYAKIYSAMAREVEKWSEIRIRDRIITKR